MEIRNGQALMQGVAMKVINGGLAQDDPDRPWSPPIDVQLAEDAVLIFADLPGMDIEQIEVHVRNGSLYITGCRAFSLPEDEDELVQLERLHGRFEGRVPVPPTAKACAMEKSYEAGVFRVRLPLVNGKCEKCRFEEEKK